MQPSNLHYTKDHEWIRVEGDTGTIGITDYAQGELGDIVYVELPEVGLELKAGDVMGTIESVKAVSELYAPVSGTVAEVNPVLDDQPETLNSDAFGEGWICRITLSDPSETEGLMNADAYEELTK
jgi:glycine cleavage system H protein